jgi:ubiquinone biosynthesis protein
MWETAGPFITEWVRNELGPEARAADWIVENVRALARLPELVRRIDYYYPAPGAAPPGPPLPELVVVKRPEWWRYAMIALGSATAGALAVWTLS